jgi:hypothetical protein
MADVKVKRQRTYSLILSEDEAVAVMTVLGSLTGGGVGRRLTDAVYEALANAGIDDDTKRFPFVGKFGDDA